MTGAHTVAGIAGLTVVATLLTACGSRDYPGPAVDLLPTGAVGAVSLGVADFVQHDLFDQNRCLTFLFDGNGEVVGRVEGDDVHRTQTLASAGRIVTVSADSVTVLTPNSRTAFGIDEHTIEVAVDDPGTGTATIWFNSGRDSTFVTVAEDGAISTGSVPGLVTVAAQCGSRAVAVAREVAPADAEGRYVSRLFEVPVGGTPIERGRWRTDPDFAAASAAAVCDGDGPSILSLHSTPPAQRSGARGLTLVRTALPDASRTEYPIAMPGYPSDTRRGSMSVQGDRLYWLTRDGAVLSVDRDDPREARREWVLPTSGQGTATVQGTTVNVFDPKPTPVFARYDLRTGVPVADPLELPWLAEIVGSATESGNNVYDVTDLDVLPATATG